MKEKSVSSSDETLRKGTRWYSTSQAVVLFALVGIWLFLSIATRNFLTFHNITNLMAQEAVEGVLAVGEVYVIITAGIDMTVGSVVALTNVILSVAITQWGMSIPAAIFMVIVIATLTGVANGALVFELGIPPFVATLGSMVAEFGLAMIIANGTNIFGLPQSIADFGSSEFLNIPVLFWMFVIVFLVGQIILKYTKFGKYVYALGSNVEAARLSGVNTRVVTYGVYTLSAFLAGVAGVMQTGRLWMGVPSTGANYNLDAIAAAAIGGASLFGAEGDVFGAVLGMTLMMSLYNGAVLLGVSSFWEEVLVGIIILLTVGADQIRKKRSGT